MRGSERAVTFPVAHSVPSDHGICCVLQPLFSDFPGLVHHSRLQTGYKRQRVNLLHIGYRTRMVNFVKISLRYNGLIYYCHERKKVNIGLL